MASFPITSLTDALMRIEKSVIAIRLMSNSVQDGRALLCSIYTYVVLPK
jgi:hypothetical protein